MICFFTGKGLYLISFLFRFFVTKLRGLGSDKDTRISDLTLAGLQETAVNLGGFGIANVIAVAKARAGADIATDTKSSSAQFVSSNLVLRDWSTMVSLSHLEVAAS